MSNPPPQYMGASRGPGIEGRRPSTTSLNLMPRRAPLDLWRRPLPDRLVVRGWRFLFSARWLESRQFPAIDTTPRPGFTCDSVVQFHRSHRTPLPFSLLRDLDLVNL